MKNTSISKNAAGSAVLAAIITFGVSGIAHAAGAGDQVGEHGSMTGHGGPVSKKDSATTGQPSSGQDASKKKDSSSGDYSRPQGSSSTKGDSGVGSGSSQGSGSSGTSSGSGGY